MPKPKFDCEAFLRSAFRQPLDAVAGFLMKLEIDPDSVTLFGLAGTIAAACLVASGRLLAGGAVMAVMAPLDAVDGALARKKGVAGKFGAFLDSVVDAGFVHPAHRSQFLAAAEPDDLLEEIRRWEPTTISKWLGPEDR